MSAIPKNTAALDALIGAQVRRTLQYEERRLIALHGDAAIVVDLISDALLLLLQAKDRYKPGKAQWQSYARMCLHSHFYRNTKASARIAKRGKEQQFSTDDLLQIEEKPHRNTRNVSESQRVQAVGVKRAMAKLRQCNQPIVADLAIRSTRGVAKDHKITHSQLKRKIGLLKQSLENEGFSEGDAV